MDLWVREARIFKYGSGTGSNFSALRGEGEPLSGGGKSSGLMSFLKIGDRAAGAIKSGGTTRRAAKMVVLDHRPSRHRGVHQLEGGRGAEGRGAGRRFQLLATAPERRPESLARRKTRRRSRSTPSTKDLRRGHQEARQGVPGQNYIERVIQLAEQGYRRRLRRIRHRLELEGVLHRLGPEQQQLGAHHQRVHGRGRERRPRLALREGAPSRRRSAKDPAGPRAVGPDRLRRLGLRRPRACSSTRRSTSGTPAPRWTPHQRVEPVLGVHVPRRHGLQPGVAEPDARFYDDDGGRFDVDAYRHACRLWTSDPRNLRVHGAVPERVGRAEVLSTTARSASATPTSARC